MLNKTWIFLFAAAIIGLANASSLEPSRDRNSWDLPDDYWDDNYLDTLFDDYGGNSDAVEINNKDSKEKTKNSEQVAAEEIDSSIRKDTDTEHKTISLSDDYQIEDNRMELKEPLVENTESSEVIKSIPEPDNIKNEYIFEETKRILNEDDEEDSKIEIAVEESKRKVPELTDDAFSVISDKSQETIDISNKNVKENDNVELVQKDIRDESPELTDDAEMWEEIQLFKAKLEQEQGEINDDDSNEKINDELNEEKDMDEEEESIDSNEETQDVGDNVPEENVADIKEKHINEDDNGETKNENESDEDEQINSDDENDDEENDNYEKDVNVSSSSETKNQSIDDTVSSEIEEDTQNPEVTNSEEKASAENDDNDTVSKVVDDLKDDFEQLFKTMDKLTSNEDDKEPSESVEEKDEDITNEDVLGYEEKYGTPFRENNILSLRGNDYESIEDSNLGTIFSDQAKEDQDDKNSDESDIFSINAASVIDGEDENESKSTENDSEQNDNESIKSPAKLSNTENTKEVFSSEEDDILKMALNDLRVVPNVRDIKQDTSEQPVASTVNSKSEGTTIELDNSELENESETKEATTFKSVDTKALSPEQYNELMTRFQEVHKDEFDTQSEDFSTHIAPIHMSLSVDTPLVVTSPNYPNNYPTNNIVDWIFDGKGMGIELNITDFAVNGALGDYLLVKPGGADETGHKGLIFSYQLREERRYRFLDVDRMFVRFESKPGLGSNRGFSFSVQMIATLPEDPEPEPEPEPLLPPPPSTLTVIVGGLTASQFLSIREEFRQLIADMATLYINTNSISHGLNSTSDVTQITSVALCNINWPNYESCAEVTFGVPVVYEDEETSRLNEEDLRTMWNTYIYQDPFALRLSRLGITEFSVPNDQTTLIVWLVIAVGVLISAAMLAFALWRYSCFQNYTRMSTYSDTDSIVNAKRGLDLYPTPHQTLPPLYSDHDLKWDDGKFDDSARVDLGGYNNSNYVRDELYDLESDEDVIAPRDRTPVVGFNTRDIYKV